MLVAAAAIHASFGAGLQTKAPAAPERPAPADEQPLPDGFWPSERMTRYALQRWSGQIAHDYQLEMEQSERLEEMMLRRWPDWMKRNRPLLQPTFNEFMEMRIAPAAPTSKEVAEWSAQAFKSFELMKKELHLAQSEFREVLSPTQKMKFDADVAKMNVGMELLQEKIRSWNRGRYAASDLWDRPTWMPPDHPDADPTRPAKSDRTDTDTEPAQAELQAPVPDSLPMDQWEAFVAGFIRRYTLDAEQITSAWTIMGDLRSRAERHKARRREEYARVEQRLAEADPSAREQLLARRDALDEPIARLFEELKERLERLLTDAQREAAHTDTPSAESRS